MLIRYVLRLEKELSDKLKNMAQKDDRSLNNFIIRILKRFVEGVDENK